MNDVQEDIKHLVMQLRSAFVLGIILIRRPVRLKTMLVDKETEVMIEFVITV